jgi:long-chain fatty acid transport protein
MRTHFSKTLLTGFALLSYQSLNAAGFQINELSPSLQASALAGAATATDDISAMAYNPATLAALQGSEIYAGGSEIIPKIGYNNAKSSIYGNYPATPTPIPNPGTITSERNISPSAFVPAVYMGTSLTPQLKIGLGVNAPFGLESNYNSNWVGQFNATESQIKTVDILPTVAYQVTPLWALGASVNFEYISATYASNFIGDQFVTFPWTIEGQGTNSLNGNAWGIGYTVGTTYKITPKTMIGLDYHSPVLEKINGQAHITGDVTVNGVPAPAFSGAIPGIGFDNGQVNLKLPAIANFGIDQQINDKLHLMAGLEWTQWSTIKGIDADIANVGQDNTTLNYHDSWLYSVGARYQFRPKWNWLVGLAYDQTPTTSQFRDARIPDTNRKWVTTGLSYTPTKALKVFATYEHIFMNNQNIDLTQQPTPAVAAAQVSANYSGSADILAAGISYKF